MHFRPRLGEECAYRLTAAPGYYYFYKNRKSRTVGFPDVLDHIHGASSSASAGGGAAAGGWRPYVQKGLRCVRANVDTTGLQYNRSTIEGAFRPNGNRLVLPVNTFDPFSDYYLEVREVRCAPLLSLEGPFYSQSGGLVLHAEGGVRDAVYRVGRGRSWESDKRRRFARWMAKQQGAAGRKIGLAYKAVLNYYQTNYLEKYAQAKVWHQAHEASGGGSVCSARGADGDFSISHFSGDTDAAYGATGNCAAPSELALHELLKAFHSSRLCLAGAVDRADWRESPFGYNGDVDGSTA